MKRRALVTGGTAGIGAAIAEALAHDGVEVIVVDVVPEKVEQYAKDTGRPAYVLDVSDFDKVESTLADIEAKHGHINILINNAGITRDGLVHKMCRRTQWNSVIEVNLSSVFNTVRVLGAGMRERGWGRIVNISSMNGQKGQFGQANYAAAKAGMIGLTKSIALEMASKGVTANCVAPGFILTEMTKAMRPDILEQEAAKIPVGRMGAPEDIAATVAFLSSKAAGFITGQVIAVNGGQYM
ncbi:beta-ketoacyl-ACP reductase [Paramagnetospirillum kuznetsovii]|uniref:Beta-ketoacyl-ACP reductase n=1 Tax=Paramagnetospirillum kuznetsovii TaxID=2053833 RepID=A0A364NVX2_9PROT|nr:3-oxoacyl-ACP reductase [Paramagnetospirillum kuznetsovii]RAU21231.1 beta-ketoacyl-ACP reductase [Paramagnetospirillum kuznetsovii]